MKLVRIGLCVFGGVVSALVPGLALAQAVTQHEHGAAAGSRWTWMQHAVIDVMFNHQGGPRGDTEFVVPNWWMGTAARGFGRHQITFTGMLSLDPATVGKSGYAEILQVGEVLDGRPLVDRQHPHDFFMHLEAAWRVKLSARAALTLSGGPVGEPALGPVAYIHRQSATGLPIAPLSHHTMDSTHISFGVATASVEVGQFTMEASAFNGREPDDDRWDFDLGKLDSASARLWFRPTKEWSAQVSTGRLRDAEALEPGVIQRTTASVSWTRNEADRTIAVTAAWGVNAAHGTTRQAFFGEGSATRGPYMFSGRIDVQQLELAKFLGAGLTFPIVDPDATATVLAASFGGGRRVLKSRWLDGTLAAQITVYGVPDVLKNTHGSFPVSAQIYLRLSSSRASSPEEHKRK